MALVITKLKTIKFKVMFAVGLNCGIWYDFLKFIVCVWNFVTLLRKVGKIRKFLKKLGVEATSTVYASCKILDFIGYDTSSRLFV